MKLLCIRKGKKKIKFEFSKFYNNSRGCVKRAHCPQVTNKKQTSFTFSFLPLKVTTKQTTKAFRNKNLKTKRGRRMEGWAWRRRRMAGHFQNSASNGSIMGYMVFSFTINHLIFIFLVFLLLAGIFFGWYPIFFLVLPVQKVVRNIRVSIPAKVLIWKIPAIPRYWLRRLKPRILLFIN